MTTQDSHPSLPSMGICTCQSSLAENSRHSRKDRSREALTTSSLRTRELPLSACHARLSATLCGPTQDSHSQVRGSDSGDLRPVFFLSCRR